MFWAALRDVFPETQEQRCWFHKIANVLNALHLVRPARREGGACRDLQRRGPRPHPGRRQDVRRRIRNQVAKAAAKITDDLDVLLAFYDYPAEHWIHLRPTNPIRSTFATIRLRQRVTKGPGSRAAGITATDLPAVVTTWRG
jgi:putative transposase